MEHEPPHVSGCASAAHGRIFTKSGRLLEERGSHVMRAGLERRVGANSIGEKSQMSRGTRKEDSSSDAFLFSWIKVSSFER